MEIDVNVIQWVATGIVGLIVWHVKQVDAKIDLLFKKQDRIRKWLLKNTEFNDDEN
jgi:hypothetical protein